MRLQWTHSERVSRLALPYATKPTLAAKPHADTASWKNCIGYTVSLLCSVRMRRQDLEALEQPYNEPSRHADDRFADALGLDLGGIRSLEDILASDLDPQEHGIGWWKAYEPQLGVRARILVSDYLVRCAASIETNLVEAKLHLLEAIDAYEREDSRLARMIELGPGNVPTPKHPRSQNAKDDLQRHLATLHTAGFFRSLASAFDCLGGCIQGVLALNGWIVAASFGSARGALKNLSPDATKDLERKTFRDTLNTIIDSAGPAGWLEWALDYRHTLVHRARRVEMTTLELESSIVDPSGRPILRARQIPQLARDPGRTDIEVWRDVKTAPVLTEPARTTMEELLKSSEHTMGKVACELANFWNSRRKDPAKLQQPGGQWPNDKSGQATGFQGYAPKLINYSPTMMLTNPNAILRMQAASIGNGKEAQWPDFSGKGDNQ